MLAKHRFNFRFCKYLKSLSFFIFILIHTIRFIRESSK